jgi:nucleoside-diphosphate-sugar epimerase
VKILIIGATGYIGNVVAEKLVDQGHSVIGMARSKESAMNLSKQGIEPLLATLDEPKGFLPIVANVDAVIYAAYGYENSESAAKELASGKSHITDMLKTLYGSGKTFIFTSGSGVFPDTGDIVYIEETAFTPIDLPLNIARRNLELEVEEAAKHNVRSIVLRPPTAYGRGGSFIVPRYLLDHALKTGDSIYIKGTENNKWSAVHVDDLADLYVLALNYAKAGSVYNTGSESGITTLSIAEAISRAAGLGGKVKSLSMQQGRDLFGHWAEWWALNNQCSGEKAKVELGWKPHRISMLEDIEKGSYAQMANASGAKT